MSHHVSTHMSLCQGILSGASQGIPEEHDNEVYSSCSVNERVSEYMTRSVTVHSFATFLIECPPCSPFGNFQSAVSILDGCVCGLVPDMNLWEILSHYCFKCFLLSFFSPWYFYCAYVTLVVVFPKCLDSLFHFLQSFSLFAFQLWKFPLTYPQTQRFLPQPSPVYLCAHKSIFHFCYNIWIASILKILSQNFHLSACVAYLFLHVVCFSIKAFSILTSVALSSWSVNFNIPDIYYENLVKFLEVKLTKLWTHNQVPWSF